MNTTSCGKFRVLLKSITGASALAGLLSLSAPSLLADEFDSIQVNNDASVSGSFWTNSLFVYNGATINGGLSVDSLNINGTSVDGSGYFNYGDINFSTLTVADWVSVTNDLQVGGGLYFGSWLNGSSPQTGAATRFVDHGNGATGISFVGNSPDVTWKWRQNGAGSAADQMVLDHAGILTLTDPGTGNALTLNPNSLAITLQPYNGAAQTFSGSSGSLPPGVSLNYNIGAVAIGNALSSDGSHGTVAMGYNGTANGTGGVALGNSTYAGAGSNTAIGNNATAMGAGAIAMGNNASAQPKTSGQNNLGTIALGDNVNSLGNGSIAIGYASNVADDGGIAIGYTQNSYNGGVALGWSGAANGSGAVGIGYNNNAIGSGALALGYVNTSTGNGALALGLSNIVSGVNSAAVGGNNNVSGSGTVALGSNLTMNANNALVAGQWNVNVSGSGGTASIFELGNGNSNNRSNAITVLQNGQVTIKSTAYSAPSSAPSAPTQAVGLIVNGATVLSGQVMISQRQGDVYMGSFTNITTDQ